MVMANQSMGLLRTEFNDFTHAGLGHVTFRYAKLNGARFNGARFNGARHRLTASLSLDTTGVSELVARLSMQGATA